MISEQEKTQAECLHVIKRLPESELPYRWQCIRCDKRLKIASGMKEIADEQGSHVQDLTRRDEGRG